MLTVFVVDDEEGIRRGIRNAIIRNDSGFCFVGEAPDGEMAMPLLQEIRPDIVIIDVCMPFMDGLELASAIRDSMPWIRILFLSGHDEFEYAQRAVALRADAYLLKPVSAEGLNAALLETAKHIELERQAIRAISLQQNAEKQRLYDKMNQFFDALLEGAFPAGTAMKRASELGIALSAKQYLVIQISSPQPNTHNLQILTVLQHWLKDKHDTFVFASKDTYVKILLLGEAENELIERAYMLAQSSAHELRHILGEEVHIGIGSAVNRLSAVCKSGEDAAQAARLAGVFGGIMGAYDILDMETQETHFDVSAAIPIVERMKHASLGDVPGLLEAYFGNIDEDDMQSILYRNYLLMDLVVNAIRLLPKTEESPLKNPEMVLRAAATKENAMQYAEQVLSHVILARSKKKMRYAVEIRAAKQFIDAHYRDETLSLHTVAKEVGFSPNHFSAVFSQEMGQTFVEYLTLVRLEAAKKILRESDARMGEVAFSVGYHDSNYFSFLFKKHEGMSPREYRSQFHKKLES